MAQRLKRPPAMQETLVQSLGWEDSLEKEMATHSSILAWGWMKEPGRLHRVAKSQTRLSDNFTSFHLRLIRLAVTSSTQPRREPEKWLLEAGQDGTSET